MTPTDDKMREAVARIIALRGTARRPPIHEYYVENRMKSHRKSSPSSQRRGQAAEARWLACEYHEAEMSDELAVITSTKGKHFRCAGPLSKGAGVNMHVVDVIGLQV